MTKTLSPAEENYLKAIYKTGERLNGANAGTNALAAELQTTPASVTDMIKRLSEKNLVFYEKYKGSSLTLEGSALAKSLIRRHRIWEVFLFEKLRYGWEEVHDIAEQLEHVHSPDLIDRLDVLLGRPRFDPHGDPIPDAEGNFTQRELILLSEMSCGASGTVAGVDEHTPIFLRQLDALKIKLHSALKIIDRFEFDGSMQILIDGLRETSVSEKIGRNLFILPVLAG